MWEVGWECWERKNFEWKWRKKWWRYINCDGKDETKYERKEGKVKDEYDSAQGDDLSSGADGLMVDGNVSAKFNDVGSNSFTSGDKIHWVIIIASIL